VPEKRRSRPDEIERFTYAACARTHTYTHTHTHTHNLPDRNEMNTNGSQCPIPALVTGSWGPLSPDKCYIRRFAFDRLLRGANHFRFEWYTDNSLSAGLYVVCCLWIYVFTIKRLSQMINPVMNFDEAAKTRRKAVQTSSWENCKTADVEVASNIIDEWRSVVLSWKFTEPQTM
jgi:hypothetical protein